MLALYPIHKIRKCSWLPYRYFYKCNYRSKIQPVVAGVLWEVEGEYKVILMQYPLLLLSMQGATRTELPEYIIEVCTQHVNSFTHSLYRW